MGVTVEGMDEWIDTLKSLPERAPKVFRAIVSKGALNIKTDWRTRWTGIRHIPMLPFTITYDTDDDGSIYTAEIGVDKDKIVGGGPIRQPGRLGNLIEYGSPNSAPRPGGRPALDAEEPRLMEAAAKAGEDLLNRNRE